MEVLWYVFADAKKSNIEVKQLLSLHEQVENTHYLLRIIKNKKIKKPWVFELRRFFGLRGGNKYNLICHPKKVITYI